MLKNNSKENENNFLENSSENSTIGPSIKIKGELSGNEDLIIKGNVNGKIELKENTLAINKEGKVKADIYAHNVIIEGNVKGNIYASNKISILEKGNVKGDIQAPKISIKEGSQYIGSVKMGLESETLPSEEKKPQKKEDKKDTPSESTEDNK
ncbi:MAG: bactofilin family protein [Candidatus Aminicenantaceae bacterium]